jgi:3-oxoacyl-[acyl-carrier-protein] synthase II
MCAKEFNQRNIGDRRAKNRRTKSSPIDFEDRRKLERRISERRATKEELEKRLWEKEIYIKNTNALKRRVVITGLGVIAPNGIGKDKFWEANIQGKSGVSRIKSFDTSHHEIKIAGAVPEFNPVNYMSSQTARRIDRFSQFGIAAAQEAIKDSKLDLKNEDRYRIGVCMGSGLGGIPFHEEQIITMQKKGFRMAHPLGIPRVAPNAVSAHISIEFNLKSSNIAISTACSSGTHGVGHATDIIRMNKADIMVAGGVEAPITPFTFAAYSALHVVSRRNDEPEKASRPFDKERDGFVIGEGAGILILEELEHAIKRNAHIYAEVVGYGSTGGAYHMVMPVNEGKDIVRAMKLSLKEAALRPEDINYINAHGTATQANDKAETYAIKEAFSKHAYKIPVSATKSMIGHSIGAAGAIEALVCALVIENNLIPPTINQESPDPECDLDYVPNKSRKAEVNAAMSNSFGIGNNNACIILKRFEN